MGSLPIVRSTLRNMMKNAFAGLYVVIGSPLILAIFLLRLIWGLVMAGWKLGDDMLESITKK